MWIKHGDDDDEDDGDGGGDDVDIDDDRVEHVLYVVQCGSNTMIYRFWPSDDDDSDGGGDDVDNVDDRGRTCFVCGSLGIKHGVFTLPHVL